MCSKKLTEKDLKKLCGKKSGGMVKTIVHRKRAGTTSMSLIGNGTFIAKCTVSLDEALLGDFSVATWEETGEQASYRNLSRKFANSFGGIRMNFEEEILINWLFLMARLSRSIKKQLNFRTGKKLFEKSLRDIFNAVPLIRY